MAGTPRADGRRTPQAGIPAHDAERPATVARDERAGAAAADRRFFLLAAIVGVWLAGEAAFSSGFVLDDNRVENVQAFALLLAAVLLLWRAPRTEAAYRPLLWILAAGTILLLLEEVSWGQRLFGFETPALVRTLNGQRETNLHNLHYLVVLAPGALLVVVALGMLFWNRAVTVRSGLVLIPRVTRVKWVVVITATLFVTIAMPLLTALGGIDAALMERIFSYEHLWQHDRSALMDPALWDRIGLDRSAVRNLIRVYQLSEGIETLIYVFILHVAAIDPRRW